MHVLSFSHDSNRYGAQRSLLTLLSGLQKLGHRTTLVLPEKGPLLNEAGRAGIPVEFCSFPYPSRRPLRALKFLLGYYPGAMALRRLVSELKPDVIHYNTSSCLAPSMALRHAPLPRVHHLRERAPALDRTSRIIAAGADTVVANCRFIASQYGRLQESHPIEVVHNGLDIYQPDSQAVEAAREKWSGGGSVPLILFAGQLRPHKDPMAVTACARLLKERGQQARFGIFGGGPMQEEIRKAISDQGLEDQIWLAGFQDSITEYMAAADVVFVPSREEPFPRVGLEAMALGKPVVSTLVGGIPEQVQDGETGLLSEAGDYENMSNDIQSLLHDPALAKRLGEAARKRHKEFFSASAYARGMEQLLISLVK